MGVKEGEESTKTRIWSKKGTSECSCGMNDWRSYKDGQRRRWEGGEGEREQQREEGGVYEEQTRVARASVRGVWDEWSWWASGIRWRHPGCGATPSE